MYFFEYKIHTKNHLISFSVFDEKEYFDWIIQFDSKYYNNNFHSPKKEKNNKQTKTNQITNNTQRDNKYK